MGFVIVQIVAHTVFGLIIRHARTDPQTYFRAGAVNYFAGMSLALAAAFSGVIWRRSWALTLIRKANAAESVKRNCAQQPSEAFPGGVATGCETKMQSRRRSRGSTPRLNGPRLNGPRLNGS